jgi:hypothetical protein
MTRSTPARPAAERLMGCSPAAVEQDDLARGGQVLDVPLEVPVGAFAFGRLGQRHDPFHAGVEVFGDPRDGAALSCRVAALEDHDEPGALGSYPLLEFDQLPLEPQQFPLVRRARQPAAGRLLLPGHPLSHLRTDVRVSLTA